MSSSITVLETNQKVHDLFRGAGELEKRVGVYALLFDIVAALMISMGILYSAPAFGIWTPLVMLIMLIISFSLQVWRRNIREFSQSCKRVSLEKYATGGAIGAALCSDYRSNAPYLSDKFTEKLPAQTMDDYYEPFLPAGSSRLRELYAHSSFYTWRLLRIFSTIQFFCSLILIFTGLALLVAAVENPSQQDAARMSELSLTVLFSTFFIKLFNSAFSSFSSMKVAKQVAQGLLQSESPEVVSEHIMAYNMDRHSGPSIPTSIYKIKRNRLQQEWYERRKALTEVSG